MPEPVLLVNTIYFWIPDSILHYIFRQRVDLLISRFHFCGTLPGIPEKTARDNRARTDPVPTHIMKAGK